MHIYKFYHTVNCNKFVSCIFKLYGIFWKKYTGKFNLRCIVICSALFITVQKSQNFSKWVESSSGCEWLERRSKNKRPEKKAICCSALWRVAVTNDSARQVTFLPAPPHPPFNNVAFHLQWTLRHNPYRYSVYWCQT